MTSYRLRDWRWPEKDELTKDECKPWRARPEKNGNNVEIEVTSPDGTRRWVYLEVDKGWLRVRTYLDEAVSNEPAGEIWLGKTEARYAKPEDLDQDALFYGRPET